ncbi:MAG TPA: hypothetical protein VF932_15580 [Anaerolineae bacterium]
MKVSTLERALRHVYDAKEKEMLCSEFFEQIAEYVDREIVGEQVAQHLPEVKYHLEHCGVCGEEYETLRDLARLEASGRMPSVDELKKSL